MLNEKIEKAINEQINEELYSSYLYLSMAAYCAQNGLVGFANWMNIQVQEELNHAKFFFDYVIERGGKVALEQIRKPKHEWSNLIEVFEETLGHERHISSRINDIASLAIEEKDHASASFLKWFIDEQVEEEASAEDMLNKLKMTKAEGAALFFLDQEAQKRVFVQPVLK
ncbi:MAG: ferritin [Candidatus Gastranaerophilales bacterium]|jgi:ferritin|nr:ferritin [Candidatus Gastranaerophilales bacterium]